MEIYFRCFEIITNSCCRKTTRCSFLSHNVYYFYYYVIFVIIIVSLYRHYRTLSPPLPPQKPSIHHQYLSLITIRSSKFIFLESLLPKVFFGGWGGRGLNLLFFFFTILDPLQKVHVYMCVCVCVDNIGSFSKVNPSLFTSFLLSSPIIFQLCPSSVVTNDFLIASILF